MTEMENKRKQDFFEVIRFCAVGVLNTVVDYSSFAL